MILRQHRISVLPSEYRAKFFSGIAERSEIKLRVFQTYLEPWASKVGSPANVQRIWIVDGFSGPGTYDDGSPGSPALALNLADRLKAAGRTFDVNCLFFEKSPKHFKSLERLCRSRANRHPVKGDFWSRLDVVSAYVQDAPCFLFVDPFGIRDLQFEALVDVINKLSKVDLMVNFMTSAVARLESKHPHYVSSAVGADEWSADTALEVFCNNLRDRCGFLQPASLPVRGASFGMDYDLVLAARHPAAYELWNNQIVKESISRLRADGADDDEITRIERETISEVRSILIKWAEGRRNWKRPALVAWFVVNQCGLASTGMIGAAVTQLINDEVWHRERVTGRIDQDQLSWNPPA